MTLPRPYEAVAAAALAVAVAVVVAAMHMYYRKKSRYTQTFFTLCRGGPTLNKKCKEEISFCLNFLLFLFQSREKNIQISFFCVARLF